MKTREEEMNEIYDNIRSGVYTLEKKNGMFGLYHANEKDWDIFKFDVMAALGLDEHPLYNEIFTLARQLTDTEGCWTWADDNLFRVADMMERLRPFALLVEDKLNPTPLQSMETELPEKIVLDLTPEELAGKGPQARSNTETSTFADFVEERPFLNAFVQPERIVTLSTPAEPCRGIDLNPRNHLYRFSADVSYRCADCGEPYEAHTTGYIRKS